MSPRKTPASATLTHFDAHGQAHMVDVAAKAATHRVAVARIAGILAAKKTIELIPLCHPLALTRVAIDFETHSQDVAGVSAVSCTATVETVGPTGVEMEALTAVQVALLTIYDMVKAVDRGMTMTDVRVLEKHGGKSGSFVRPA